MVSYKYILLSLSLFLLFLLLPLILSQSISPEKASAFTFFGRVLGKDDDKDEDKEDDHKDEDKEDDHKDEDKEDDHKDEDKEDDHKDEDKKDDHKDEDKKDEGKKETYSTTVNDNGTRTVTKKKVEDDGKVEVELKTYGVDGKVIEEYKSKEGENESEAEYEAKITSESSGKVSEIKFKSKDGEEFKLMIKNEDQSITKVRYDENHNYIRIIGKTDDDENEIEDESENENESESDEIGDDILLRNDDDGTYELEHLGRKARVTLPLTVDDTDGSILLLTSEGEVRLNNLPDTILNKVEGSDDSIEISDIEIIEKDGKVVYQITAEKAQSILGLFETRINKLISYDAETGEEIESAESFWNRMVEFMSF